MSEDSIEDAKIINHNCYPTCAALWTFKDEMHKSLADMNGGLTKALEGVGNFRIFQEDARNDLDIIKRALEEQAAYRKARIEAEVKVKEDAKKAHEEAIQNAIDARERAKSARELQMWIAGGVCFLLLCISGWGINKIWNIVAPPAAAIIQEYWKNHPETRVVTHPQGAAEVYSSTYIHQDAGMPAEYRR